MSVIPIRHLNNGVDTFFLKRNCEVGLLYIDFACQIMRYNMAQHNLRGQIRVYISSKLGNVPCINVDIHEYMDEYTKVQTKQLLETLLQTGMYDYNESDEFDCMRRWSISIPIIYSFHGNVHR